MTIELSKTEAWLLRKWGKFSASKMDCLLSNGKGELLGVGAKTYIKEVAKQSHTIFNQEDSVETYAMRMGKVNEPNAFALYYRVIGLPTMEYYGGENPVFMPCPYVPEEAGCSPDCVCYTSEGDASFGAQFKCLSGNNHFDLLLNVKSASDLKRYNRDYYTQCQFEMECFGVDLWHFAAFNEYFPLKHKLHIIEVKKDEAFLDDLRNRLGEAIKLKYEYLRLINL